MDEQDQIEGYIEKLINEKKFIEIHTEATIHGLRMAAILAKGLKEKQCCITTKNITKENKERTVILLTDKTNVDENKIEISQENMERLKKQLHIEEKRRKKQKVPDIFEIKSLPLHKALTYTTKPYIPGISGDEEAAINLCKQLHIPLKQEGKFRSYLNLTDQERMQLLKEIETRTRETITKTTFEKDKRTYMEIGINNNLPGLALGLLLKNKRSKIELDQLFQKEQKEFITLLKNYNKYKKAETKQISIIAVENSKTKHLQRLLEYIEKGKTIIITNTTLEGNTELYYTGEKSIIQQLLTGTNAPMIESKCTLTTEQEKIFIKNCNEKLQNLTVEEKIN